MISKLYGLEVISFFVALIPAFLFKVINPCSSSNNKALASLVVSLGTIILSPLATLLKSFLLPA